MKKSAIVVGATGLVGANLVKQLCEREEYISVLTLNRNPLNIKHEKLVQKMISFDDLVEGDLEYADEVFCCLGTTRKKAGSREQFEKVDFEYPLRVAAIAKNKGIEHFLVISAMGASEHSAAYYSRVKGKVEGALIKMGFPRLSIIRPSLLTGERKEFRLGERFGAAIMKVTNPLLIGGLKKYRSIEASQVAMAMIAIALSNDKEPVKIYKSNKLLEFKIPGIAHEYENEEQPFERDSVFNWSKIKVIENEVVDREVQFARKKDNIEEK